LINHLTLWYPFNYDYVSDVEENDHHCLHFRLAHSSFFYPRSSGTLPTHQLSLRFWMVLKNPRFITCEDILRQTRLFCDSFHYVRENVFLLSFCS
jgi:hypothetical protein